MEVMGLMLGSFVDDYTIRVVDVFAMPQRGTGVSVEAVDPVFQQEMIDLLKQTGRDEMVVGWYHSHPGFGPWLSGTDVQTQQSFEMLHPRCVAVVLDPIQSVPGKVVIDAFRLINPQQAMAGVEPRQTTANIGLLQKPSIQTLIRGLNKAYYSIAINYRKNDFEMKMLESLNKVAWSDSLKIKDVEENHEENETQLKELARLAELYHKQIEDEIKKTDEELVVSTVGKINPKNHLKTNIEESLTKNILQCLGTMMNTEIF